MEYLVDLNILILHVILFPKKDSMDFDVDELYAS